MPHWCDPLVTFLAEQPPETASVTLTYAELEAVAGGSLPTVALVRNHWRNRTPGHVAYRLVAVSWRIRHIHGRPPTFTFVREPPEGRG